MNIRASRTTAMIAGAITALGMPLVELVMAAASTVFWKNAVFIGGFALFLALPVFLLVFGTTLNARRAADPSGSEFAIERRAAVGRALCWFLGAGFVSALISLLG